MPGLIPPTCAPPCCTGLSGDTKRSLCVRSSTAQTTRIAEVEGVRAQRLWSGHVASVSTYLPAASIALGDTVDCLSASDQHHFPLPARAGETGDHENEQVFI